MGCSIVGRDVRGLARCRRVAARALAGALTLLLLGSGIPATGPAETDSAGSVPGSVRILAPLASDVVHGKTAIRVEVIPFEGRRVLKVEIHADGALLSADPLPPFEALWESGDRLDSRTIRAVALFGDGSRAEELVQTRGLRFTESEIVESTPIEHVELLVSVTDGRGRPVTGMEAADLEILEGDDPVGITDFSPLAARVDLPLSVALLVDRSGSMNVHMDRIARAATELLSVMRPVDQVRVAAFSEEMVVLQDFTRDPLSLLESLDEVGPPAGGTRLFRAVRDTVRDLRDRPGRKVIVVLTDGLDTDFTSPSGPITTNMYAVLGEVVRTASRAGVTIIVVLPGPTGRGYLAVQDLAVQTGGWFAYPGDDFATMVRALGERLLGGYVVGYDVARPADPDRKRRVRARLAPGLPADHEVRTALGTYAALDLRDALADDLAGGTPSQRARAAREIGLLAADESAGLLMEALDDPDPGVRAAAVTALAERGEIAAIEDVLDKMRDADEAVRAAVFEAAVRFGEAAVPRLAEEATRWRGGVREQALLALGSIGGERAATVVASALGHERCSVRAAGAEAAERLLAGRADGGHGGSEGTTLRLEEALRALASDPCPEAAEAAGAALGRLGASGRIGRPETSPGG